LKKFTCEIRPPPPTFSVKHFNVTIVWTPLRQCVHQIPRKHGRRIAVHECLENKPEVGLSAILKVIGVDLCSGVSQQGRL
jgi:hypothetical protein